MPTKRLSSSAAKQGRTPVSALAITVAAALGMLAMPAFSADAKSAAKEDTITVVGGSNTAQQESAWGPVGTYVAKRSATGTKTDTQLVKTPQSVSVVTREQMDILQPTSVKEALGYTPGVMVGSRGSSNVYDAVYIRGFGSVNQNEYLDGLKLQGDYFNEASIDPYFLERAEVLRGPSSVLYGKSSPGGIVSLVSKRPTNEPIREVQFKMGTDSLFQTGFDFSDALDEEGKYAFRLTGLAKDANDQQNMAKVKRYAVAPSFSWQPDDHTNLTLYSYLQNDPNMGYYGWLPMQGTVQPAPYGKLPANFNEGEKSNFYSRQTRMFGYSFYHDLNDTWTVRQNLRYMQLHTNQNNVYGNGVAADNVTLNRNYIVSNERLNNFSVDTQAQAKFATGQVEHTLLSGVDFMRMSNDIEGGWGIASTLNLANPQFGNYTKGALNRTSKVDGQQQIGIYMQEQAEWNNWILTAGTRYDWAKSTVEDRVADSYSKQKDHQSTNRIGLNYLFDNGISPYVSYAQSFEPNVGAAYGGKAFVPSKGEQYEAGLKFMPKDKPVSATIAIYQLTKSNNLVTDVQHANEGWYQQQTGKIRSRGLELEGKAALNANVNLLASYTYTNAEYTEDTTNKGNTPAIIPKHMASLWGDYTFHETALSGLTFGAGVRYTGSSFGDEANTFKVPASTVWNTVLKYDLARFNLPGSSIALNVNNLFDKQYVSSCFATYGCFWGAERQVVATATFRF
ncbi:MULTISPECIES: ferrichrome porin FhuA [Serratia]|uniref:ferrichrome porin FhuA n=1 Tax=Serratia TaxID=613 RepID=UPI000745554F|nr:ferrichrome porin FhuA [Serratia marcescens]MDP8622162.1 ferrichrome porin FhuA [Serratia marcescens]CUZ92913.1 Ferric hydroxamate uptake [Serratia marcescens]CVA03579.1 Ferric hydroxamate uptake [Serratia marcescens]CVA05972.1 Ferric hydroxamate uptake [Serratia marcescens]CVB08397.1 Ferric hydroxamate uptake [Serratia marcescens]